jgi:hypothetical protein
VTVEKKIFIGEIEEKFVVIVVALALFTFGHTAGRGARISWAGDLSCAKLAIPGETSLMMELILPSFIAELSESRSKPRDMALATSMEALERLTRT